MNIKDCWLSSTNGNGYGSIRFDSTAGISEAPASIQIDSVVTGQGDWGFYANGTGNSPCFIVVNNMQINNPRAGGMYFGAGSQVWLDYAWIPMAGCGAITTTGILCDSSFEGWLCMNNSVIQSPGGYGVHLKSGQGFNFCGNSFGGCGHSNANNYDDIRIEAGVSNVSVEGNHFDIDQYNVMNGARSAIYVVQGASNVNVTGNMFASTPYGTATIIDAGVVVTGGANANWTRGFGNITPDSEWSGVSGYAQLRFRKSDDGNFLEVDGLLQHSTAITSSVSVNSNNPLPYGPKYNAYFPGNVNGRAPVQIQPNGVLLAIGIANSTNTFAEFHCRVPLN
jgi:hypothetical protein